MKFIQYIFILSLLTFTSCNTLNVFNGSQKGSKKIVNELGEDSSIPSYTSFECNYIYNAMDYRLNEYRVETEYEELFSYTHSKLKSYYTKQHFMECFSSLASLGESNYLYLKIFFNSNQASKSYGSILKGEHLRMTLMNGEKLFLESMTNAIASKIKNENKIVFDGIFSISQSELQAISKIEVDRLGIMWTHGYEEYDIRNIQLLKNQANCLKQKLP